MTPNFSVSACLTIVLNISVSLSLCLHTPPPHTENQYIKILTAIISELNGYFVFYTFLNFTKSFILKLNF